MMLLTTRLLTNFSKWSKPKPKANKVKQNKKSFALGDEKAAKLSKSEQEQQNKLKLMETQKIQQATKEKIKIVQRHDISLQQYISPKKLEQIRQKQYYYLRGVSVPSIKPKSQTQALNKNAFYRIDEQAALSEDNTRKKKQPVYGNYTAVINKKYKNEIQTELEPKQQYRRMGSLGIKLGMTTMWNSWGHAVPVTVVHLDRCQVIQIKQPRHGNTKYQVQMGLGQKNMKRITKSLLGHFVKARVPPKRVVAEFKVSKQCLLPVGYMMSSRHYTPGMFVDVVGKTVGHGFQGTIKRFGFKRQPASHGNSLTTRVLGSTGGRQDPGRVFKNKKMYGRMGGKMRTQMGLQVFKIDVDKNIVYLKGSVPGKPGTIIKLRDTSIPQKIESNLQLVHYPTFVEKQGQRYAKQFSMYCGQRDPAQIQIHDNAYILDDDVEQAAPVADKDALEQ